MPRARRPPTRQRSFGILPARVDPRDAGAFFESEGRRDHGRCGFFDRRCSARRQRGPALRPRVLGARPDHDERGLPRCGPAARRASRGGDVVRDLVRGRHAARRHRRGAFRRLAGGGPRSDRRGVLPAARGGVLRGAAVAHEAPHARGLLSGPLRTRAPKRWARS